MMKKFYLSFLFCFASLFNFCANADQPVNGPNYKILTASLPPTLHVNPNQILILDFFSYGCPHCYHLSKAVTQWITLNRDKIAFDNQDATSHHAKIIFHGVPIAWNAFWTYDQKAYEIAHLLKKESVFNPILFEIAQNPLLGISSDDQLRSVFLHHGVDETTFNKILSSPELKKATDDDMELAKYFKIMEIPCMIIIKNKTLYYVSNLTIHPITPEQFIATVAQLTQTRV